MDTSIINLIQNQSIKNPNNIAILNGWDGYGMTYRELEVRSNQIAHFLFDKLNIKKGSIVAVLSEKKNELIICMLAILKTGAAYVPIDDNYPDSRIGKIIGDLDNHVFLYSKKFGNRNIRKDNSFTLEDLIENSKFNKKTSLKIDIRLDDLAYVVFTSGSKGMPKGVMASHGNLLNYTNWCIDFFAYSDFKIHYVCASIGFDLSVMEIYFPLAAGKSLRLLQSSTFLLSYLKREKEKQVMLTLVPSVANEVLKIPKILDCVTDVGLTGEAISDHLLEAFKAYPNLNLYNLYGPTETTVITTCYKIDLNNKEVLIGKPISNTAVYVLNENLQKLPIECEGDIYISGKGVSLGYINNIELTREFFLPDHFVENQIMYKTGDRGKVKSDGNIVFLGRLDDQHKINGNRIELGEINNALNLNPKISNSYVFVLINTNQQKKIVAAIEQNQDQSEDETITYLKDILPSYMIPNYFIYLPKFPLTSSGKTDRNLITNLFKAQNNEFI